MKKILFRLGLDLKLAEPWETVIHQLLNRRNDVAHGTAKDGLEETAYAALENRVNLVTDELVRSISNAVAGRAYLASGPAQPPSLAQ